jgi:hypothetical protein
MGKVRAWLSHSAALRRLGRLLFPPPPEWGQAPPALDQRSDGPGWSLAQSLMFAGMAALGLGELSGGWRIILGALLVVAVGRAMFLAVGMARRRWRRRSVRDQGMRGAERGNPE